MVAGKNRIRIGRHEFERNPLKEKAGGVLHAVDLQLSVGEVQQWLGKNPPHAHLMEAVSNILESCRSLWQPMAVYRWCELVWEENEKVCINAQGSDQSVCLTMGGASSFLGKARKILVGVYTVGRELEEHAERATREKRVFDGYLYDIIGLAALDALAAAVGSVAENYAAERGWGVGPLLSPGSVQGWDMGDQAILCSLLPLQMIDVKIQDNGVLAPFKSISFIIGTGPDYRAARVAHTCDVCSKRDDCIMHKSC